MTEWRDYCAIVQGNNPWIVTTFNMFGTPIGEHSFDIETDAEDFIATLQDIDPEFKLIIE